MDPSPTSSPVPPDELVAHAGFVRRVALAVLWDDADADDATQDTLATALARGPSVPAARRSWLATVVRNVAAGMRRQGARRHRREERGARSEATPSAADLAARAETIRLVAEAVAGLDSIDRDVVVLRHYDDLPPREIAARLGVSVATVKSRLQRAHGRLRARLEVEGPREGGRQWRALALCAGVRLDGPGSVTSATAAVAKGMVMTSGGKGIAAATVLLVAGATLWIVARRADPEAERPPGAVADAAERDGPVLAGHAAPRVGVETPVLGAPQAAPPVMAVGIVVDGDRRPIAGAEVVATIEGRETGRVRSADDGRFEVPLGPCGRGARIGQLVFRTGDRGAVRTAYVSPDSESRLDYGRIPLEGLHALVVRVLRTGRPVAGAEVVLSAPDASVGGATPEVVRADVEGLARFQGVPGPKVGLHAVAPGTGRAYREVRLPAEGVVDLELPDDRSATIHVKHGLTGAPVPGAEVYLGGGGTQPMPRGRGCLPPYPDLRTDAEGRLVVSGLPQGYVSVVARAPGLALRSNGMTVEGVFLKPDEGEGTVTLFPYRAVRFPIVTADVGAPPEGSFLEVRRYQPLVGYDVGEPVARVEDGRLVLAPFPPGFDRGHVVTPDGRWAMWTAPIDKDVGEPVAFRKIHDVRVKLLWKDGTPAAEQVLWVLLRPRGSSGKVRTAADGSAVFPRCVAETATLLWTPVEEGFGMPIGGVSLLTDPGLLPVTIDRPIDIVLRLLRAGTPGIPAGIQVRVPDLDPSRPTGGSRSLSREIQEDATTGKLRFRWLPMPDGSAPPVTVRADGVPEVTVRPERAADGVWRADAELAKGTTLRVRVTPPAGGRYWLQLERWTDAQQRFGSMHDHPAYVAGQQAVDGLHVMPGLSPGRYRLVDAYSNLASVPIVIGAGGGDVAVDFDLAAVVEVRGRVEVPAGENPAYASIVVKGRTEGFVSTMNPTPVKPDGTFAFRAVRGERLALVARHPLLLSHVEAISFVVGQDEVVLPLEPGPHVAFRIEGSDLTTADPDPSTSPSWQSPVQVRAYGPGAADAEGAVQPAIAKEGRLRAGVPDPGTWALRIEQRGFVPILLENVKVGVGPTDLGTLRFSEGATLTVRLLPGAGGGPQNLAVQASLEGERSYTCWGGPLQPGDPPTVTVKGLGLGRFKLVVQRGFRGATVAETWVDSDGRSPISVDVKLP